MEKKQKITNDPVQLFNKMSKDPVWKSDVPNRCLKGEPFWGTGCEDDIFKAHPSALNAIPYKPRH